MSKNKNSFLINFTYTIILLFIFFFILRIGKPVIIPFLIALLFSFSIIGLSNSYKKLKIPSFISFLLSIATHIFILRLIGKMIGTNIKELNELLPIYQRRIIEIYHYIFEYLKIPEPKSINEIIKNINLESILAQIIQASRSISSQMGLILLFLIFILLENRFLNKKLYLILRNHPRNTEILDIIEKIKSDVKTYFLVKTIISVSTGLFCYLIMWCFGLNFAIFWGLLAFLLNYIPNIGSIIAVFLPVSMSLVQPEFTFGDSFLLAILLTITQIILGNIVEPQLMGNRLNISPLFLITSLALWGNIWGIPGMILSVPIMVIINIILAEIPAMRPIAILLSEKGDLQIELNKVIKNRKKLLKSFKSKFDVIDDLIKKK